MDFQKLYPWNWFKHEEPESHKQDVIPVKSDNQSLSPVSHINNLNQLHREIDRLFDDAFRGSGLPLHSRSEFLNQFFSDDSAQTFRASINIASDDRQYTITLEAPGLSQDDLSIELKDRVLVIKGSKQEQQEDKNKHYYRRECRYGAFERVLAIPDDADIDAIQANMDKGLLTINIPRKETGKSGVKKIAIKNV
ncbi:heat shock protein Hsp20 [Nitrosomonas marina]|uniref:Heat shock protein Hsp20 n=1 Tax=Nitrosomonas marina TaxID=917 RepID=A0A1I0FMM0_9PROT|nr:Hsp20/alpha crystallin family protein [Nitrosomonas marina]SET58737.1 heat shock protein Hsp20 [Nitrosomonas marina]